MGRLIAGILAILILCALLYQIISRTRLGSMLFFLRVPISAGLLLLGFPVISQILARSLLGNILIFDDSLNFFWAALFTLLYNLMVIQTADIILNHGHRRYGDACFPKNTYLLSTQWYLWLGLSLPVLITTIYLNRNSGLLTILFFYALGVLAALLIAAITHSLTNVIKTKVIEKEIEKEKDPNPGVMMAAVQKIKENNPENGYFEMVNDRMQLAGDHPRAVASVTICMIVYFLFMFFFEPTSNLVPAIGYVFFLVMLIGFVLAGTTFLFDRYRIPVLSTLCVLFVLKYAALDINHVYRLYWDQPSPNPITETHEPFYEAVENRLSKQDQETAPKERVMVVVGASGGGIQAAAWTARTLTGLQDALGEEFTEAVTMISSVSGGSVGSLFAINAMRDGVIFSPTVDTPGSRSIHDIVPTQVVESAMGNSLDATGWGLVFPDLQRLVFCNLMKNYKDRGWALEQTFEKRMVEQWLPGNKYLETTPTFNDWETLVRNGHLPIPVFNATIVESGARYILSPMDFPAAAQALRFRSYYAGSDIHASTAARLSATFPYVTPIARAEVDVAAAKGPVPPKPYHVADGGYFDNFGIFTIVEWLDHVILPKREELGIKKVIIISINGFPKTDSDDQPSVLPGWLAASAGPIVTLNNVRGSTQTARNDEEISLLQGKYDPFDQNSADLQARNESEVDSLTRNLKAKYPSTHIVSFDVRFDLTDTKEQAQVDNQHGDMKDRINTVFGSDYNPPLSWKLSQVEKSAVYYAWKTYLNSPEFLLLKDCWDAGPAPCTVPDPTAKND